MALADAITGAGDRGVVVIITGALAPYTHRLYNDLAALIDRPLHVLVCTSRESSRSWRIDGARAYKLEVLPGLRWHRSTVVNHYFNPSVLLRLLTLRPAAVVLNDFSPTMLLAAVTARLCRIPYAVRTDGVPETDPGGRFGLRRIIRSVVARGASFGIGPSRGSQALLSHCGLTAPFALSPLFPTWVPSAERPARDRGFDILFCGTLNDDVKGARFFTDVVLGCAERGRHLSVRVVGEGSLRSEMESRLSSAGIHAVFDGFLQQQGVAEAFMSARMFLFTSRGDVWGIVVQEALQSGTVVVASPHSGAARELLAEQGAGLVLPLDHETWIMAILTLLEDEVRCTALRAAGRRALSSYGARHATRAYVEMLDAVLPAAATRGEARRW